MKIGELEIYLSDGLLLVGSGGDPEFDLLVSDPPASDARHIMIATRAQIAPVRVGIWRGVAPAVARKVFHGDVLLSTGYLTIREGSEPPFFTWPVAAAGSRISLSIGTDAWEPSTEVTVVVDQQSDFLPDVNNRTRFVSRAAETASISQIDRVLSGYNYPPDRLASALRILRIASVDGVSEARIRYGIASVVEWLKWLHPAISADVLDGVPEVIRDSLSRNESEEMGALAVLALISTALDVNLEELLVARR